MDHQVDHSALRVMDQKVNGQFPVAVAMSKSAMRGLDYRSESVKMALVLAASFGNMREAMQGYHRVGRFGDQCWRVSFKDIPLVNPREAAAYRMQAFQFISAMQAKPVQMKPVTVKAIAVPAEATKSVAKLPKYKSKMGAKRVQALTGESADKTKQTTINFGGAANKAHQ